jgi:hypothetical protein
MLIPVNLSFPAEAGGGIGRQVPPGMGGEVVEGGVVGVEDEDEGFGVVVMVDDGLEVEDEVMGPDLVVTDDDEGLTEVEAEDAVPGMHWE